VVVDLNPLLILHLAATTGILEIASHLLAVVVHHGVVVALVAVDEARPTPVDRRRTSMDSARCASRRGTMLPTAGIASTQTTSLKRSTPTLPLITMTLTATGTRTLVQQIISPVSMIN
jgi:hypothetical protein